MPAPRKTYSRYYTVGVSKELDDMLTSYIRDNKERKLTQSDAIRELTKSSLESDVAQHNIVLSNLLLEALTLKTREQVRDWERRMKGAVVTDE